VPTNAVLLAALGLMWVFAVAAVVVRAPKLAPAFGVVLLLQLAFGTFGTFAGLRGGNPGIVNAIAVELVAPVLFWTLTWAVDAGLVRSALSFLAVMTSVLSTTIVLYVAEQKGLLPPIVPRSVLVGSGSGFNDLGTYTEIRFYGLSTLAAAGPIWIASLFVPRDGLLPHILLRSCAAASAMTAALLGGRQAIVLTMVAAPLLLWGCSRVIGRPAHPFNAAGAPAAGRGSRTLRMSVALAGVLAVVTLLGPVAFGLDAVGPVGGAFDALGSLFGGGKEWNADSGIRIEESGQLLAGWASAPVGGHGFGAVIHDYSRSVARPWNFELQYHMLLFQTGVVGALLLAVVLACCVRALRLAVRQCPQYSATLAVTVVGATALLLANYANPYLQAPGHMWAIYLPLALGNAMLTGAGPAQTSPPTAEPATVQPATVQPATVEPATVQPATGAPPGGQPPASSIAARHAASHAWKE
jgi:hypothetical protein